jgi:hypothetical protein
MNEIEDAIIEDYSGKFILISIKEESGNGKIILRGNSFCKFHDDILKHVIKTELKDKKLKAKCLGGGKIIINLDDKTITLRSKSTQYGMEDRNITVSMLKEKFPTFNIKSV